MLTDELYPILELKIPELTVREVGFLELTGQAHKENVNSRVYAYFLDNTLHPEIASVFMKALSQLIKRKSSKDLSLFDFTCLTEVTTVKGNRIDLLIANQDSAIIIENKIYHYLNNDLADYYNHVNLPAQNKAAVVLSLKPVKTTGHADFINITHQEWMEEIKSIGLPANLELKKYVYLNDFITTIHQLTSSEGMNEQTQFFFKYPTQVMKAVATYEEAYRYIIVQLAMVAEHVGWTLYGRSGNYRHIWDEANQKQAYYAIVFDDVFAETKKIMVVLELYKVAMSKTALLDEALTNNLTAKNLDKGASTSTTYKHYLTKTYPLAMNELKNLGPFLIEKIDRDFKPVMDVVLNTLETQ